MPQACLTPSEGPSNRSASNRHDARTEIKYGTHCRSNRRHRPAPVRASLRFVLGVDAKHLRSITRCETHMLFAASTPPTLNLSSPSSSGPSISAVCASGSMRSTCDAFQGAKTILPFAASTPLSTILAPTVQFWSSISAVCALGSMRNTCDASQGATYTCRSPRARR